MILQNLLEDILAVLGDPEWPASEVIINLFSTLMVFCLTFPTDRELSFYIDWVYTVDRSTGCQEIGSVHKDLCYRMAGHHCLQNSTRIQTSPRWQFYLDARMVETTRV